MDWNTVLAEGMTGSADILVRMALILIPLIIAMEMLRGSGLMEKISNRLSFVAWFFSREKGATLPILVGGLFGLTNGAGVLLEHRKENSLSEKENKQVAEIVALNHGWIEDTMLFAIVGANFFIILFTRILFAAAVQKLETLFEGLEKQVFQKQ